ncbi:uncharacterized protein LOC143179648 [Calliopsis andreniformis]|uniref:uncharacterized protein LOC143179648 n=1 Tax=Calliopsis andreniformis TaxID=337506 RepID=UPI003FCED98E
MKTLSHCQTHGQWIRFYECFGGFDCRRRRVTRICRNHQSTRHDPLTMTHQYPCPPRSIQFSKNQSYLGKSWPIFPERVHQGVVCGHRFILSYIDAKLCIAHKSHA